MPAACVFSAVGDRWHRLDAINRLVIFGDSTTRLEGCATWLAHFLRSVNHKRDLTEAPRVEASSYAVPGQTVEDDLASQLAAFFAQHPRKGGPSTAPALDPLRTLYVFWLGTNDCGRTGAEDLEEIVDTIFDDGLDELYVHAGARNFLVIDVPPNDRSPAALALPHDLSARYATWNAVLTAKAPHFASENTHASVFLFSAHAAISSVLDDPLAFGFSADDAGAEGGQIWADEMHLTSAVHAVVARRLEEALRAV
ncbi:hypothetical protein BKA93DRAFT_270144 [Sparassis latifolia]